MESISLSAMGKRLAELAPHELRETLGDVPALAGVRRLDHHAHERLGAGRPEEHAAAKPVSIMCPDCSPPSAQPRRTSSAITWRSPTGVVATSMPASPIAW